MPSIAGRFSMSSAVTIRVCKLALRLGIRIPGSRSFDPYWFDSMPISEIARSDGIRLVLDDTWAIVRRLEANGVSPKQAEAIAGAMAVVLNNSLENLSHSFVSKAEMQRNLMLQESKLARFKEELKDSQDHQFASLQHKFGKLRVDLDKLYSDIRYEIYKGTAGQRLDLNLEIGRTRDLLNNHNQVTTDLSNRIDHEMNALHADIEATKCKVIMCCRASLVFVSIVGGLAMVRMLM